MISWNLLIIPLAALLRTVFGWIENSFEDGKVDLFEWKELGATIFRMLLPIIGLMYAFDLSPGVASGIGIVIDWIVVKLYNAFK